MIEIIKNGNPEESKGKHKYEYKIGNDNFRLVVAPGEKQFVITFYKLNKPQRISVNNNDHPIHDGTIPPSDDKSIPNDGNKVNGVVIPFVDDKFIAKWGAFWESVGNKLGSAIEWLNDWINKKYDKNNLFTVSKVQKDVSEVVNEFYNKSSDIYDKARRLSDSLSSLSKEDSKKLVQALNGDIDKSELKSEYVGIYNEMREKIDKNASELV
jgi:disulfide oxidoreductase YuzD